jgi:putative redox protein
VLTMRMYAERKGWPIEEIRAEVSHAKVHAADCEACEHADGDIGVLTRTITMTGDLDDDQRTRMMRIADRCPVHRTLEGQIEVRTTLR